MAKNKSNDKKNVWKGIQKRLSTGKKPQETDPIKFGESQSKSSSMVSVEEDFKDAEDEDDDYFQSEDSDKEESVQEVFEEVIDEKKRPVSEMAFILPALQNHGYDSDEESLQEEGVESLEVRQPRVETKPVKERVSEELSKEESTATDSLGTLAQEPSGAQQTLEIEEMRRERPATFEPIPAEKPQVESLPTVKKTTVKDSQRTTDVVDRGTEALKEPKENSDRVDSETRHSQVAAEPIGTVCDTKSSVSPDLSDTKWCVPEAKAEDVPEAKVEETVPDTERENVAEARVEEIVPDQKKENGAFDKKREETESKESNRLANILPGVEESLRNIASTSDLKKSLETQNAPALPSPSRGFEYSIEDPIDLDLFRDNVIAIEAVDPKSIPVNELKPRQQEEADQPIREGMKHLFDNRFMKAKRIFETRSTVDPLYALGLGAMAFIKAIMTFHEFDRETAMSALATAYTIAKAQIDNTCLKKPFKETVSSYFNTILSSSKNGLPADPPVSSMPNLGGGLSDPSAFMPNGVLRAHVVKAECCLLMGILQMTQESVVGYLKCGLNIRRAYHSYGIVWREYKRMGQEYTKYMDCDTVSAIQFGIGSVHLILSSMPPKILKIFSLLGWKSDKQLGFALLKLCLEGRGIRAPLASLMLLAYYSVLTSFAPQLYSQDIMSPAIECLLDAQGNHPNSCFFLFFAARISRVAKNLPLSIQSFQFASESSKGEWTEVAMKQLSDYEIGFNHTLQLEWGSAIEYFEQLVQEKYWSPAFSQYLVGACYEMMGQRTEAILAFAQVSVIKDQAKKSYIDTYVEKKVEFFQRSGYQDLDFSLPAIEIFLVLNAFEYLEEGSLESCLERVDRTLEMIHEREKLEYTVRLRELVPSSAPPDYYDQRCILLLTKASILNALGRHDETIPHLNWVLDHRDCISYESWIIPFTYWESGITSWKMANYVKSRKLWQLAMACTKYDFEYRMAVRLSLALSKCDDMGITHIDEKELKGETTNNRKRMPILSTTSQTA